MEAKTNEIEWLKSELAKRDKKLADKEALAKKQAERLYEKDQDWQQRLDAVLGDYQRLLAAPPQKRKKILGIF